MAIYLLGCSKGGVGKTTLSVNVAVHLALAGRRVCLVDCDEQLHANAWTAKRLECAPKALRIPCRVLTGSVAEPLRALAVEYDDLVVDVRGRDIQELRSAMRVGHVIVMPFSAGQFDLYAVEVMDGMLSIAREYNPGLRALAFLNKVETNWVRSQAAVDAAAFIDQFPSMHRAETLVYLRSSPYYACAEKGLSVFELGRGAAEKAAAEVANLMQEVSCLISKEPHDVDAETEERRRVGTRSAGRRRAPQA